MTVFMLDTNTVSYLVHGQERVERLVFSKRHQDLCISCITEAELLYGLDRQPAATRKATMVREFLDRVASLPWGREEARWFGQTRAAMQRSGKSLQPLDMLIAAHALSLGATLVTSDQAFRHVPGLAVEDWS